jgi:hypothetical protein
LIREHVVENTGAVGSPLLAAPVTARLRDISKSNRFFIGP